jgi:hypothetical protein
MRTAPAYRIIPLNVAHSARETSRNAQEASRLEALPLEAVPFNELVEIRLYSAPQFPRDGRSKMPSTVKIGYRDAFKKSLLLLVTY